MIADALISKRRSSPIELCWGAEHMAGTMYSVLESLWKARSELEKRA
jgi:hypothetical protein